MSRVRRFKVVFFVTITMAVMLAVVVVVRNVFSSDPSISEDRLAAVEVGNLALSVVGHIQKDGIRERGS